MNASLAKGSNLLPLEREALLAAYSAPSRTLRRMRGGYVALDADVRTSGQATAQAFTGRVMNMLWRRGLIVYDELECPSRATLTRMGVERAAALTSSLTVQGFPHGK